MVRELRRVGKRIAIGLEGDLWVVLHLMIAGRLHWKPPHVRLAGRQNLAAFDFPHGSLTLTEAGAKRRASLHILKGDDALQSVDPGGIDVFKADIDSFRAALTIENHTLKRALTDPRIFSGIGNAYSDEILHRARLSPVALTHRLTDEAVARLFRAVVRTHLPYLPELHTPDEDLWFFRSRVFAACEVWVGGAPDGFIAFRDGWVDHLYVGAEHQRRGLGSATRCARALLAMPARPAAVNLPARR